MSIQPAVSPFFPGMPSFTDSQEVFLATVRLQAQAYKAAMRFQIEMLNFLKHRYEQDVKLADDLVATDAFTDTFDVVTDFLQGAAAEYTSEAGKMLSISSKLSSGTARRVRKQGAEVAEALAARTVV